MERRPVCHRCFTVLSPVEAMAGAICSVCTQDLAAAARADGGVPQHQEPADAH